MNRIVASVFLLIAIGIGAYIIFLPQNATTHTVTLTESGFTPSSLTIRKGDKVTFITNRPKPFWPASNLHPTHEIFPEFDPKQPIDSGASWSFTFTKEGNWKYHDHLAPNFTGIVSVRDKNENTMVNNYDQLISTCGEMGSVGDKQKCWDDILESTLKTQGLKPAFALFGELYKTEPSIPKACHGWSHVLGKAAFDLYRDQKEIILVPEASYCGYGFYHGFIEKLLQTTGNIKETREFCEYAAKQIPDQPGVYGNCLHGIGHGSVDVEDEQNWGNFQAMIISGLKNCEAILDDSEELRLCWDGAFNAMQQYAFRGEFQLSFDRSDPFRFCRNQEKRHQTSCFFEFAGLMSYVTDHNFTRAASFISQIPSDEDDKIYINKLSADFMQDDIVNANQQKNISDCRSLPNYLRESCFLGILNGFIQHGDPQNWKARGQEFCQDPTLTVDERNSCYQWMKSS